MVLCIMLTAHERSTKEGYSAHNKIPTERAYLSYFDPYF